MKKGQAFKVGSYVYIWNGKKAISITDGTAHTYTPRDTEQLVKLTARNIVRPTLKFKSIKIGERFKLYSTEYERITPIKVSYSTFNCRRISDSMAYFISDNESVVRP